MWSAASVASAAKGVAHAMPRVTNTLAAVSRRIQSQRRASMGIAVLPSRDLAASATDGIRALPAAQPAGPRTSLFDHLIRSLQERWRDRQAEALGGSPVDHQLEGGGLQHRQVGRLGTLEDLVDVTGGAPVQLDRIGPVGQQGPDLQ